jgi:hypothetical protein
VRSISAHRGATWRAAHLTLGLAAVLATAVVGTSRLVTAQPPQAPPDRITLRSPDGRSEVVIAVSDSGVLRITLGPRGDMVRARLPRPASLRLVVRQQPALELRDDREQLVASLGGPLFRRTER